MAERLRTKKTVVADGEDRLSTLPDELIQLVLSFLPSRQAVQTCVLATRWRTLWKSVPAIRLDANVGTYQFGQDLSHFVHSLLQHRDPTPLRECEVLFYDHHHGQDEEVIERDFDLWLRYAVSCKARVIRFEIIVYFPLRLSAGTLISQHLTRLILHNVWFDDFSLDVLGCQLLEVLDIQECVINIETVFPKSLQHLMIRDTDLYPMQTRCVISAPGLVILELVRCFTWTPLLESLPSLVTAFINTGSCCGDNCRNSPSGDCGFESCVQCYGTDDCVLLQGLSGATNLELITHKSMIFRNDIKWSPMFNKVKTLLLGDWCMAANFCGLVYFLHHSPILQRLTLELASRSEEFHIETSEIYKPTDQFLVSKHLKAVKINHVKDDKRIHQLLTVLAYHGVHSELINIEEKEDDPERFSFQHK
ncbi:hypothetical protein ACQJBY_045334 [Aegilops geniculata]